MSSKEPTPNEKLVQYLNIFLPRDSDNANDELEARFGTKRPTTQIQFDAVIAKLKSLGFITDNLSGNYRLTIQTESIALFIKSSVIFASPKTINGLLPPISRPTVFKLLSPEYFIK